MKIRNFKLEISISTIFGIMLVALLWNMLSTVYQYLPIILIGFLILVFILVIVPLPFLTDEKIEESEKFAPKYLAQIILSSIIGIIAIVAVATVLNRNRFSTSFDLTTSKIHSLSPESIKILADLNQEIKIYCIPDQDPRNTFCDENFHLRNLYVQKNNKIQTRAFNLTNPNDIAELNELKPSGLSRLLIISGEKRNEIVGSVDESKLTNALIGIIKSKKVVYFLTGNGEPGITLQTERSYEKIVTDLKNRNYDVKEFSPLNSGDIPLDSELVVAGSSEVPYNQIIENVLRRFIARGGRLILTINPLRDPGMPKLFSDLGVKVEPSILVHNGGVTMDGRRAATLDPIRPPVFIGLFNKSNPVTSEFPMSFAFVDAAKQLSFQAKESPYKVKHTALMDAFHAAPVSIPDQNMLSKIPEKGPMGLKLDSNFDPDKTYTAGLDVEVTGDIAKIAEGIPPAEYKNAENKDSQKTEPKKDLVSDLMKKSDGNEDSTDDKNNSKDNKDDKKKLDSEVIILGFDLYPPASMRQWEVIKSLLLPPAVAHLYKDKDLISIPAKDFAPKKFKLEKNPGNYIALFAFFPSLATALMGFYIWMRRRSS